MLILKGDCSFRCANCDTLIESDFIVNIEKCLNHSGNIYCPYCKDVVIKISVTDKKEERK